VSPRVGLSGGLEGVEIGYEMMHRMKN